MRPPQRRIYVGVTYRRDLGKWTAQLRNGRRVIYVGRYKTQLEAAKAYDRVAYRIRGKEAQLNFPEEHGVVKLKIGTETGSDTLLPMGLAT